MLTKREFYGEQFYCFIQNKFDVSRNYLKNCGKPVDLYDKWLVSFHRENSNILDNI